MSREETTVQRTAACQHFPTSQPIKFNCSKLFNLKTDGGMSNKKVSKPQSQEVENQQCDWKRKSAKKTIGEFHKTIYLLSRTLSSTRTSNWKKV